jgi:hypothetical protein
LFLKRTKQATLAGGRKPKRRLEPRASCEATLTIPESTEPNPPPSVSEEASITFR